MHRGKSKSFTICRKHFWFSFLLISALFGFSFYSGEDDGSDTFVTRIAEQFRIPKGEIVYSHRDLWKYNQ